MSSVFLGNNAAVVTNAPDLGAYSKVIIRISDEEEITVGDDSGRVLEINCPWGTVEMANNILNGLIGFAYQPYQAEGSLLNPAAELGDSVTVHGIYGGIYKRGIYFDDLHSTDIAAPVDEEIDHEYQYEPAEERRVRRQFEAVDAALTIQGNEIAARVSRTGGDNSSFGWSLTEDGFVLSSNNRAVFEATSEGIKVHGVIEATSGYIGNENYGFTITSNAIYNGVTGYTDTEHNGIYLGTNGIVLGKGAFKVDASGNFYANNGTFAGNIYAGNIQYGGNAGYFNGSGIGGGSIPSGKLGSGSVSKSNLASSITAWLKQENIDVEATKAFVATLGSGSGYLNTSTGKITSSFYYQGSYISKRTYTVPGTSTTIRYLGY